MCEFVSNNSLFVGQLYEDKSLALHARDLIFTTDLQTMNSGFIRVREMSGKFKFFQGQGIVREFYVVSGKIECLLKCQGNVREFYNFQFVLNDEEQKIARAVFLTFLIQA